jgi:hypothetical protein
MLQNRKQIDGSFSRAGHVLYSCSPAGGNLDNGGSARQ